jgi:hypothetical protein
MQRERKGIVAGAQRLSTGIGYYRGEVYRAAEQVYTMLAS